MRPGVFDRLAGVELILHAGDVGGSSVLDELRTIAPVRAVYGNTDAPGDPLLEARLDLMLGRVTVHVSHGHELGSPTPARLLETYDANVIVYGHTHKALVDRSSGRLVINPGAAGPRRFNLKPSVARLTIDGARADVEILTL